MKQAQGQSTYIADKIHPIIEQIFKITEPGLAFCYCCKEFISLHDSIESDFIKHFETDTSEEHLEFISLYFQHHKNENNQNILINNEKLFRKDVTDEIKQNMFHQIKDRQAFCKWCNKIINVTGSIGEEFMIHFNDKFHEQFFTNLMKGEKNLNKQEIYKYFKNNNLAKRYMIQHKEKFDGEIKQSLIQLIDADTTQEWIKKKVKMEEMQLNEFLELNKKYFEFFISELIKIECYLEALCFLLAIIGKEELQICELRFESFAEEIKILSPNELLSKQLLKMLQNSFVILWEQIGFTKEGYLLEQPFQVKKLRQLLDQVKGSLTKTLQDEDYQDFLVKVQIEKLNNLSKNLYQKSLLSDENKKKKTEEKLIEEETNKDKW